MIVRVAFLLLLVVYPFSLFARDLSIKAETYQEFDPITQFPVVFKYQKRRTRIHYDAQQRTLKVEIGKPTMKTEIPIDTVMYATTAMGEAISFYDTHRRRVLQILEISIAQRYHTCELLLEKTDGQWTQYNYWRCYPKNYTQFRVGLLGLPPKQR